MAVKASAAVTLSTIRDIQSVTWYYLLQPSTASAPAKPTTLTPPTIATSGYSGWSDTEPSYTDGDTRSLYVTEKTVYTDGTFEYTTPSLSSSYEAAKQAYNKAQNAYDNTSRFILGTGTSAGLWKGSFDKKALANGDQITFWINIAGASLQPNNATVAANIKGGIPATLTSGFGGTWLNLTLSDGSESGWYPCFYGGTSRLTTHYAVNNAVRLTFKTGISITISGTTYTVSGWWADANYNTDTVDNRLVYFGGKTGAKGIWQTSLFMEDGSGTYQNICTASDGTVTSSNRTTAQTKKANTSGFKVGSPIWYSNATYAANTNISGSNVIYSAYANVIDSRYAFNTPNSTSGNLTAYKPIYLVGTINASDGLFYLDSTWWTQTPNTTGKIYVLVGAAYDTYRYMLYENNSWFIYDGTRLVDFNKASSDDAAKMATSYITAIDSDGIKVHAANNPDNNYSKIDANGMTVYKGGEMVSQFGDIVYIGNNTGKNSYFEIQKQKITGYNYRNSQYFAVGDISNQEFSVSYTTVAGTTSNGGKYGQKDILETATITKVTVDGEVNTDWSRDNPWSPPYRGITFPIQKPPGEGKELIIYYTFTGLSPFFTFNNRKSGSFVGIGSFSEGYLCTASGYYSHAEGYKTEARGFYSHAEGQETIAAGYNGGHAEGRGCISYDGHAEGGYTKASGSYAHSEGYRTQASGRSSHASGEQTLAKDESNFVIGRYNKFATTFERDEDGWIYKWTSGVGAYDYPFSIGNGEDDDSRNNCFVVDWNGNVFMDGYLNIGDVKSCSWYQQRDNALIRRTKSISDTAMYPILDAKTYLGDWAMVTYGDDLWFSFIENSYYISKSNTQKGYLKITSEGAIAPSGQYRSKGNALFVTANLSADNQSIAKSSTSELTFSIAKSGYTPIAIRGFDIDNASSSGANVGSCVVLAAKIKDASTALFQIRNNATSAAKIKLWLYVTYIATAAL